MGLPVHDRTASTAQLAKAMLMDLDRSRETTPVRTATLELLLKTIVEMATPASFGRASEEARRTVSSMIPPATLTDRGGNGSRL